MDLALTDCCDFFLSSAASLLFLPSPVITRGLSSPSPATQLFFCHISAFILLFVFPPERHRKSAQSLKQEKMFTFIPKQTSTEVTVRCSSGNH